MKVNNPVAMATQTRVAMPNIRCLSFTLTKALPQLGQELLKELATTLHLLQTLFSIPFIYILPKKSQ